jgi:hypothetical protein
MKKQIFGIVALLILVSAISFAGNTTATVTATVLAATNVTKTADLALGTVAQGASVTVLSTDAAAAAFTVSGTANYATVCAFTYPTTLANGSNTLTFAGQIPIYSTSSTQSSGTAFSALAGGTTTTGSAGELYLWVGGKVTATSSQAAGSYTGVITVTVTQP